MTYVVPFEAVHFARLEPQAVQQWAKEHHGDMRVAEGPHAITVMQDGQPVLCGGAVEIWTGRAHLWSMLSSKASAANFLGIHRHVTGFLDGLPFRRLEAAVDVDFEAGHRWMRLLGFTCEAPRMRAYEVDGHDSALYARVRT